METFTDGSTGKFSHPQKDKQNNEEMIVGRVGWDDGECSGGGEGGSDMHPADLTPFPPCVFSPFLYHTLP